MTKDKSIEVIVRCFNEEQWIINCLEGIAMQTIKPSKVTIVDNQSTDSTVKRAMHCQKNLQLPISIEEYINKDGIYKPGECLNKYVLSSTEKYVVILSAHCIPANKEWLECLYNAIIKDHFIAAAYGRQIPTSRSDPRDARDLLWTFGQEKREQRKDIFFHNANSIIRTKILKKYPFDPRVRNIEDRIWAKKILEGGELKIVYEPKSIVFHEHGIHQSGKIKRAESILKIAKECTDREVYDEIRKNLSIIVPYKTSGNTEKDKQLIAKTIEQTKKIRETQNIRHVIISTYTSEERFQDLKAINRDITWINRLPNVEKTPSIQEILLESAELAMEKNIFIEQMLVIEPKYTNRSEKTIQRLIEKYYSTSSAVVMTQLNLKLHIWKESKGKMFRIDSSELGKISQEKIILSVRGLGVITSIENLRSQYWLDTSVAFVDVENAGEIYED